MSRSPIKKHDRDDKVQERVREHKNRDWQNWTSCEMYGHYYEDGEETCRDCGTHID